MNITGVGVVSSYGQGFDRLHSGLASGSRHLVRSPWDQNGPWVASSGIICTGSRTTALALLAAEEALQGFSLAERKDMGIIVGGTTGGMHESEAPFLENKDGLSRCNAQLVADHPINASCRDVAERFSLLGPQTTVVSACSSGLVAAIVARQWLRNDYCKRVLAVGVDALCRLTVTGFSALSSIDAEGTRPFQRHRGGITIGEGAGAFVLELGGERRVRATILGASVSAEAHHATQPDPSGRGAERAMRLALADAHLEPAAIGCVSAHGTGTPHNDTMECGAIARVVGQKVPVSSQKSQLGHTLGAAGAIELAACVAMLEHGLVYHTHGLTAENLDPECAGVEQVFHQPKRARLRAILKNSFAFGGQNACLVLGPS